MTDPVSLSAGAIAVLVATKAFEKTGEKLSESTWNLVSKFLGSLKRKDPSTATAIEKVAQQPKLADQQPEDYGEAVLVEKVESAANSDSEIAAAVKALADAVKSQVPPTTIENWKGINIKGGSPTINNPNFTF